MWGPEIGEEWVGMGFAFRKKNHSDCSRAVPEQSSREEMDQDVGGDREK